MFRVGIVLDWNIFASSLMNIVQNNFRELGKLMNSKKSFTIAAIKASSMGIGDINQHFDCIHVPNMGGYKFLNKKSLSCKNIVLGLSGIDEPIYGEEVYINKSLWRRNKPLIQQEILNWKKYVSKISAIHVVTNSEVREFNEYLAIPKEKMTIIPHGVNHDLFKAPSNKTELKRKILEKFGLSNNDYYIHISELNFARKNIFRLFDAYIQAKQSGMQHDLIVVGQHLPIIRDKAKKIPGIKLLGYVSNNDLSELIQGSDALVLPSIHEGFGMPLVEAMACGVPSITTNRHSPPEVVGDSGILVDPYDVSAIAKKMVELSKNKELLYDLSRLALERSKNFSWEKNAQKILALYEKVNKSSNYDFEEKHDLAAYRTLTTVCELYPDEKQNLIASLLKFDYRKMIDWALEYGLENEKTKDFLIPFEKWLNEHQKIKSVV